MSQGTGIQWTDATWISVTGCTHVSSGCDRCYSVKMTHRLESMGQSKYTGLTVMNPRGDRHFNGVVKCHDDALEIPLRWRKPRMIFVNSMSDLFHKDVPFEFIDKVFAVMALCPQHTFQVLTKRPERMAEYLCDYRSPMGFKSDENVASEMIQAVGNAHPVELWKRFRYQMLSDVGWPLPNVWLGTSVENQATADERIPHLLRCPARVRFLSVEPILEAVNLRPQIGPHCHCNPVSEPTPCDEYHETGQCSHTPSRISWVIVGGESGPGARPYALEWASDIIGPCRSAGVPVFHKQCGSFPVTTNYNLHDFPDGTKHVAWGDYAAGARLKFKDSKGGDMSEWPEDLRVREFPK